MTSKAITTERVLELIDAYGAEPGGWPEGERATAEALIAAEPAQFASALTEARALDQLLLSESVDEPGSQLLDDILADAPAPALERKKLFGGLSTILFPQGVRWPAGAAFASLLMGLVGGYAYASGDVGYDEADAAYYAAFSVDGSDSWLSLE